MNLGTHAESTGSAFGSLKRRHFWKIKACDPIRSALANVFYIDIPTPLHHIYIYTGMFQHLSGCEGALFHSCGTKGEAVSHCVVRYICLVQHPSTDVCRGRSSVLWPPTLVLHGVDPKPQPDLNTKLYCIFMNPSVGEDMRKQTQYTSSMSCSNRSATGSTTFEGFLDEGFFMMLVNFFFAGFLIAFIAFMAFMAVETFTALPAMAYMTDRRWALRMNELNPIEFELSQDTIQSTSSTMLWL